MKSASPPDPCCSVATALTSCGRSSPDAICSAQWHATRWLPDRLSRFSLLLFVLHHAVDDLPHGDPRLVLAEVDDR